MIGKALFDVRLSSHTVIGADTHEKYRRNSIDEAFE